MCDSSVSVGRSVSDKAASGASKTKKKFGIRNQGRLKSRDSLSEGRTKIGGLRVTRSRCEPNYVVSAINAAAPSKRRNTEWCAVEVLLAFRKITDLGPGFGEKCDYCFFLLVSICTVLTGFLQHYTLHGAQRGD